MTDPAGRPGTGGVRSAARGRGLLRSLRLRCPYCGIGHVMQSWFSVRRACAECGLRFERDEEQDYWLGAYTINFIVTELLFALLLVITLVLTWPDPPWTAITVFGVVQMSLTPVLFYPFAKSLWLAIDLVFRPAKPEDFGDATRENGTAAAG